MRTASSALTFSLLAALSLATESARAASFGEDGTLIFDPNAAALWDFEGGVMLDTPAASVVESETALSGGHVLSLTPFASIDLTIELPKTKASYRVSLWIRGSETVGDLQIAYSERTSEVAALYPTGRMTSDGWVELANDHLRVDGARVVKVSIGLFSAAGSEVDAIEVTADADLSKVGDMNPPCKGAADASACGVDQACYFSECRNLSGWVPPIPADRDDVARYLRARIELLFGPYLERTEDFPAVMAALDRMRFAKDPWTYWNGFMLAMRRLHDGHTTTGGLADFVLENPKPLSICFLEGDADLSQTVAPKDPHYLDVLVSHVGADHNLGLRAGDRIVAVDGQHPIAWARSLIEIYWAEPTTSNHRTYAEMASRLRSMISRFANTIDVVRCDPVTSVCGEVETISIADLPEDPPGAPIDAVQCDNRPLRHLASSPADHANGGSEVYSGIVVESDAAEGIYGLEWESLYTSNGSDGVGAALKAAVTSWKNDPARGVILDHRTGNGGTNLASAILWNYAVPRRASDVYFDRKRASDEQPTLAEGIAIFDDALSKGLVDYVGTTTPVTDVPVALLVTQDVSASDWLPLGMKGAPNVKIFGPYETNGGFSTRYSFGYWLSMSYVIATGDTFIADGSTLNGTGVSPDVVVLPKQSDLLIGKDTVYEAAIEWVRQGLGP